MGIHKSEARKILEGIELIRELDGKTLQDIADKYGTTKQTVSNVLTEQLQNKPPLILAEGSDGFEEGLLAVRGVGEWLKSPERISIMEHKKAILIENFDEYE